MAGIDVGKHTSAPYSTYATNVEGVFCTYFVQVCMCIFFRFCKTTVQHYIHRL